MIRATLLTALASGAAGALESSNMNGFNYAIHNPNANGKWTGDYKDIDPLAESFTVYSPEIRTLYGQVFWTMMPPVPVPPAVVQKYDGKTMAIVGYECNQVMKDPAGGPDIPVPINAAYNHHHGAVIKGKGAKLVKMAGVMTSHGERESWVAVDTRPLGSAERAAGPASVTMHEGNGGEFRQVRGWCCWCCWCCW